MDRNGSTPGDRCGEGSIKLDSGDDFEGFKIYINSFVKSKSFWHYRREFIRCYTKVFCSRLKGRNAKKMG